MGERSLKFSGERIKGEMKIDEIEKPETGEKERGEGEERGEREERKRS